MFDRIVQFVMLPVSVPVWMVMVAIQQKMEPVNLDDFVLVVQ
jgi:hypothetical protein